MFLKSTNEVMADTLYTLLREKSYHEITKLDMIRRSGLNRTTLDRFFKNADVLFESVCEAEQSEIRSLFTDRKVTSSEELHRITRDTVCAICNRTGRLSLLIGTNGNSSLLVRFSSVLFGALLEEAEKNGFADGYARFMIGTYAAAAVSALYRCGYQPEYAEAARMALSYRDLAISGSLFRDVACVLSEEYGGTPEEQQLLLEAAVRMHAEYDGHIFSVTKLLTDVPISRVKFYKLYKSLSDFTEKAHNVCRFISSMYIEKAANGSLFYAKTLSAELLRILRLCGTLRDRENAPLIRSAADIFLTGMMLTYDRMRLSLTQKFARETEQDRDCDGMFYLAAVQYSFIYAAIQPEVSKAALSDYLSRFTEEIRNCPAIPYSGCE